MHFVEKSKWQLSARLELFYGRRPQSLLVRWKLQLKFHVDRIYEFEDIGVLTFSIFGISGYAVSKNFGFGGLQPFISLRETASYEPLCAEVRLTVFTARCTYCSAKRDIAIVSRQSVRLSLSSVDDRIYSDDKLCSLYQSVLCTQTSRQRPVVHSEP